MRESGFDARSDEERAGDWPTVRRLSKLRELPRYEARPATTWSPGYLHEVNQLRRRGDITRPEARRMLGLPEHSGIQAALRRLLGGVYILWLRAQIRLRAR